MPKQLDTALTLLRQYKKENVTNLLAAKGLPTSGTWDKLEERIRAAVGDGSLTLAELAASLDEAEESGHQHVFLYTMPTRIARELRNRDTLVQRAADAELASLVGARTRLVIKPRATTFTGIRLGDSTLIIKWAEWRRWRAELLDENETPGQLAQVYRMEEGRAVSLLRINTEEGLAELRISDTGRQSRRDYVIREREDLQRLDWLLERKHLQRLALRPAISRIRDSGEVQERGHKYHTPTGTTADWTSSDTETDLTADPSYRASEQAAQTLDSFRYNSYWLPQDGTPLARKVRTVIYADGLGNEVRFPSACTGDEEAYILSRIRHFAAQAELGGGSSG